MHNFTLKRPLLALLAVGAIAPLAPLGACSSDPAATDAGPAPTTTTTTTATTTTTTPTPDASATATDAATPDAPPPVDASPDAPTEAGACTDKGATDVKLNPANSGTDPSGKTSIQLVDACQGTSAPLPYAGSRVRFTPTTGVNHYLLVTSTNPADFYKSASVVYNFPPGVRTDTDVSVFAKTTMGSFDATYNAAKAHFYLVINRAEPTCDASGFVVTIPAHPEAVVQYADSGSFNPNLALTASAGDRGANVFISNVTPGTGLVEFAGAKAGCKLTGVAFPVPLSANKYPLVADTVTRAVMNTSL